MIKIHVLPIMTIMVFSFVGVLAYAQTPVPTVTPTPSPTPSPQSESDPNQWTPLVEECPKSTMFDILHPSLNFFLTNGVHSLTSLNNPVNTTFAIEDIFNLNKLTADLRINLTRSISSPAKKAADNVAEETLFGVLGSTLEGTVSRAVSGDKAIIIGYDSGSIYSPKKIKKKVSEWAQGDAGDQTASFIKSKAYLAQLTNNQSRDSIGRFGLLTGVFFDERGNIRRLQFGSVSFQKELETTSFTSLPPARPQTIITTRPIL